jgi:hypothetical protein
MRQATVRTLETAARGERHKEDLEILGVLAVDAFDVKNAACFFLFSRVNFHCSLFIPASYSPPGERRRNL